MAIHSFFAVRPPASRAPRMEGRSDRGPVGSRRTVLASIAAPRRAKLGEPCSQLTPPSSARAILARRRRRLDTTARRRLGRGMQFAAPAEHYDRFMGRYTPTLAAALADVADVEAGRARARRGLRAGWARERAGRARRRRERGGDRSGAAVRGACRERNPGADVREGVAEALPWADGEFDAALSSLVIAFMRDPDAGVRRDGPRDAQPAARSRPACGTSRPVA